MKKILKLLFLVQLCCLTASICYSSESLCSDEEVITVDLKAINGDNRGRPRSLNIIPIDCYYFNGQINLNYRTPITGSVTVCVVAMSSGTVWQDSFNVGNEDACLAVSQAQGSYYVIISVAGAAYEGYYYL